MGGQESVNNKAAEGGDVSHISSLNTAGLVIHNTQTDRILHAHPLLLVVTQRNKMIREEMIRAIKQPSGE